MTILELLLLSLSLSMDAFAVSVCRGLSAGRVNARSLCSVGAWFGGAQALMPIAGYAVGVRFADIADRWSHILSFSMLSFVGLQMIINAAKDSDSPDNDGSGAAVMLPLAAATSMDALAVGVMLAFLHCNILLSAAVIGSVTAVMSAAGMKLGSIFGLRCRDGAELCGGITLVALGVKMLLAGI